MIPICVSHLDSKIAAGKVGLAHEALGLGTMFSDCLHYQVDLIGGDANMALYRAAGRNQESVDIRAGHASKHPRLFPGGLDGEPKVFLNVPPSGTACFVKQCLSPQAV